MRQTEDWANVTWEMLKPPWMDVSKIDLEYRIPWNKAFKVTYFEYRHRIKQIAMSGWPFDFVYCDPNKLASEIDDDDLVVPSDDDDWFGPNLEKLLCSSDDEFIMWDSVVNRMTYNFGLCPHKKFNPEIPLASNGYAFRGSAIKRASKEQRWQMLMSHAYAELTANEMACSSLDRRDLLLSVYNWHIGSFTALIKVYDPLIIKRLLPKNDPVLLPKRWQWMEPQYGQVVDLVQSL